MRRPGVAAIGALVLGLLAPAVASATTANDLCAPNANPCVLSTDILVTAGSTLDFGARDFEIAASGIIRVPAGATLRILAHRVTLRPGIGGRIRGNTSVAPLLVQIDVTEDVIFEREGTSRGRIDVKGESGGGRVSILADGDVDMGGEILAQGTTTIADGGSVEFTAAGNVTVNGNIDVSAGLDGVGGDVVVQAGGTFLSGTVTPEPLIDARGGIEGGSIELLSGPLLNLGARVNVNGTGAGSDGGFVDLAAVGDLNVLSEVRSEGSGSIDFGGFGGDIVLTAGGSISVTELVSLSGGFPDGEGGTLDVTAGVDLVQGAQLLGHGLGVFGFGGTFLLTAGRTATLGALIDLHGGDQGGGGYLQVQGGQQVEALSEVNANGEGGYVLLSTLRAAPTGPIVPGAVTVSGNLHAQPLATGFGGTINLQGCDVTVTASGVLATAGASAAENLLQGSGQITVRGRLTAPTAPAGANTIQYRDPGKIPSLTGATIAPPAVVTLQTNLPPCEAPPPVCGNGFPEPPGEQCDDGDTTGGDGCSATCTVEPCFACSGIPSICVPTGGPGCVTTTTSTSTTSTSTTTSSTVVPSTTSTTSTSSSTTLPGASTTTSTLGPSTTSTTSTSSSTTVPSTSTTTSTVVTTTSTIETTTSTVATTTSTIETTTSTVATTTSTIETTTSTVATTTSTIETTTSTTETTTTTVETTTSTTEATTSTTTSTVPTSSTTATSSTATSTSTSSTSTVTTPPAPATCPGGCDDGDPCTTNDCVDGVCQTGDVSGVRRATCVCERSTSAQCAGEAISPRFTKKVRMACAQIARAAAREPAKAKKPARSAVKSWKAAGRLLGKRAVANDLTVGCIAALKAAVNDAVARTQILLPR